jgi:hypothetical protein
MGVGFVLHAGACLAYGSRIQRYLESVGESPAFWSSGAFLRNYLRARRVAKRRGHHPEFLRRFELAEVIAWTVVVCGLVAAIVSEVRGHG